MAPKKGKADPEAETEIPLDDNGNPVDEVAIDSLEGTLSEELISSNIDEALEAIHQERIAEISIPFAASLSLNDIVRVVAWSEPGKDLGSEDAAAEDESWCIEAEPTASRIDSWARGSVPTKAKKKADAFSSVEHMKGHISPGAMSVNSKSSRGKFSQRTGEPTLLFPRFFIRLAHLPTRFAYQQGVGEGTDPGGFLPLSSPLWSFLSI